MRTSAFLLLGIAVVVGKMAFAGSKSSLQTVSHVDLTRYVGRWYEIARYPTHFEKDCASDVTATYTQRSGGKIEVVNECRTGDGRVKRSKGTASVVDKRTNAKLKVTFFWPFSGNYWIIDLAPDYSYAVVGEPDRKYLWILSRSSQLTESVYGQIVTRVRELGYDPSLLMKTTHSGPEPLAGARSN
jgi:apolipoprotein D and lipocalin family protein